MRYLNGQALNKRSHGFAQLTVLFFPFLTMSGRRCFTAAFKLKVVQYADAQNKSVAAKEFKVDRRRVVPAAGGTAETSEISPKDWPL